MRDAWYVHKQTDSSQILMKVRTLLLFFFFKSKVFHCLKAKAYQEGNKLNNLFMAKLAGAEI